MAISRDKGFDVVERDITRSELYVADEVFMTGTAAEVTPVRSIDDHVIGEGRAGPKTRSIQQTFAAAVKGDLPKYEHWLDIV
jgi:branched-chain amino acid aminotransferase